MALSNTNLGVSSIPNKFVEAFGVPHDIRRLVEDFDLTQINVQNSSNEDALVYLLAPSLGDLTGEVVRDMDRDLKVAFSASTRAVAKLDDQTRDWEHLIATLQQNPVLECRDTGQIARADRLAKEGSSILSLAGGGRDTMSAEVEQWFRSLVQDEDILKATPLKSGDLATIITAASQAGSGTDGGISPFWLSADTGYDKTIVDIGALHYPGAASRIFKAYHIKLNIWSYSTTTLGFKNTRYGITGQFNCKLFQPRSEIISRLSQDTVDRIVEETNHIFS